MPDGGSTSDTGGDVAHGSIVVVADPDGDEVVGSVANGPVISHIIGSTSFNRDDLAGNDKLGVGAKSSGAGIVIEENVGDKIGRSAVKDAVGSWKRWGGGGRGGGVGSFVGESV